MVERVFIGDDSSTFKLRVSKPGHEARTAVLNNLTVHENMRPLIPVLSGYAAVPAGVISGSGVNPSEATIFLGVGFAFPPKIVLRNNLNIFGRMTAKLNLSTGRLTFQNSHPQAMTVRYVIFNPV